MIGLVGDLLFAGEEIYWAGEPVVEAVTDCPRERIAGDEWARLHHRSLFFSRGLHWVEQQVAPLEGRYSSHRVSHAQKISVEVLYHVRSQNVKNF